MKKYNIEDLNSKDPKVRYPAAKAIMELARTEPEEVYPDIDVFISLLDGKKKVLVWNSVRTIGSLAGVDKDGKIDSVIPKLYGLLNAGNMITANNTVAALADIALARPDLRQEITHELMKVENYKYQTEECGRITVGGVIQSMDSYFGEYENKAPVIEFVKRYTNSSRKSTAEKARVFLKKYAPEEEVAPAA